MKSYENKLCHSLHICIEDKDIITCDNLIKENNISIDTLRLFEQQKQIGLLLMQYHLLYSELMHFN